MFTLALALHMLLDCPSLCPSVPSEVFVILLCFVVCLGGQFNQLNSSLAAFECYHYIHCNVGLSLRKCLLQFC